VTNACFNLTLWWSALWLFAECGACIFWCTAYPKRSMGRTVCARHLQGWKRLSVAA